MTRLLNPKFIALAFGLLFTLNSCEEEEAKIKFDRKGLLENYASNIIVPAFDNLKSASALLSTSATAFVTTPDAETLATVRIHFDNAYLDYQRAGLFDFGPAMDQSFEEQLNTYPANTSTINANIVSGTYDLSSSTNLNAKGFPALDFLLYGEDSDQATIELFTTDANAAKRRQYLLDLVNDIKTKVESVHNAWSTSGGNYAAQFIANDGHDVGSSLGLILNTMNEYFEREIRDNKIGIPSGIRASGTPTPNNVEALYSEKSIALAIESVEAYRDLFMGDSELTGEGAGFDDYLGALNAKYKDSQALSDQIQSQLNLCLQKLAAVPDPLSTSVTVNATAVQEAYTELQKLLVLLKSDSSSALGILITYEDNDGD